MSVDCRSFDAFFDQGRSNGSLSQSAQEHLSNCASCRALWAFFHSDSGATLPDGMIERIQRRLPAVKPVSPIGSLRSVWFLLAFLAVVVAGAQMWGMATLRYMKPWQYGPWMVVLAASVALLSLSLSKQMEPGSSFAITHLRLICGVILAFLTMTLTLFAWQSGTTRWNVYCLIGGLVLGSPAALACWCLTFRGALRGHGAFATCGLLGALAGVAIVECSCYQLDVLHQVFHVAALPIGAVIGYGASNLRFLRNLLPNRIEET